MFELPIISNIDLKDKVSEIEWNTRIDLAAWLVIA